MNSKQARDKLHTQYFSMVNEIRDLEELVLQAKERCSKALVKLNSKDADIGSLPLIPSTRDMLVLVHKLGRYSTKVDLILALHYDSNPTYYK